MVPRLSVIICAHNPRLDYLHRVLDGLKEQTLPSTDWELLLVDNHSTAPLASQIDISWHPQGRHLLETTLGLPAARRCGIKNSRATVLVFVDDDNLLATDYLSQAFSIASEHPKLGTFGGSVLPEFERRPDESLMLFMPYLAIRERNMVCVGSSIDHWNALPVGAGLCVRSEVAAHYLYSDSTTGRTGTALAGHDDYEISYLGCTNGWQMAVFPCLKVTHLIPASRVTRSYLHRLVLQTEVSGYLFNHRWRGVVPRSILTPRAAASAVKTLLTKRGADRIRSLLVLAARHKARAAINKSN